MKVTKKRVFFSNRRGQRKRGEDENKDFKYPVL